MKLSIAQAARMGGASIPVGVPTKCVCPIRKHKRDDKTFRVYLSRQGEELWKCWSCDEPDNCGDALKLLAVLTGRDRKELWRELSEQGYNIGSGQGLKTYRPTPSLMARRFVEPRTAPVETLPLPREHVERWLRNPLDKVDSWLRWRGLPECSWHDWNVLSLGGDYLGFLYRDPDSGQPVRVKARGMREKKFWNEPRPDPERPGAKAKAPLWLADRIVVGAPAIIVEGEMDALSLAVLGFENVVSLPDGSESASTVDLAPLRAACDTWVVATDDDEPGEKAWRSLAERARGTGNRAVRRRIEVHGRRFKDANEALAAGATREDFAACLDLGGAPMAAAS